MVPVFRDQIFWELTICGTTDGTYIAKQHVNSADVNKRNKKDTTDAIPSTKDNARLISDL